MVKVFDLINSYDFLRSLRLCDLGVNSKMPDIAKLEKYGYKEFISFIMVTVFIMRFYHLIFLLFLPLNVFAEGQRVITASSPANRVALLELYTSEGCSSCPPAEEWLSNLKDSGISSQQLIPLAFHVTYWDYIGWRDQFASERHDQRQRKIAQYNSQNTIYTPQFVLSGSDYRTYNRFSSDVREIVSKESDVDLKLSLQQKDISNLDVELLINTERSNVKDIAFFIAVYEDDLSVEVSDGENEGELLHHDYVVRQIHGPFIQNASDTSFSFKQAVVIGESWKQENLFLVAFAQDYRAGGVLQAVRLKLQE